MKKALSLALALLMVLSLLPVAAFAAEARYDDIGGHWAESSIERWSEYKIVEGSGGHFRPDASLTRGEMAKILAGTLGLTEEGAENPFADVAADAWYAPYVLRCYVAGIMKGDGANAKPTASITRQEAMVMLCRALAIAEKAEADLSAYGDSADVADWAKGAVAALTEGKIVNGVDGNLVPGKDIDRASIMAILDRAIVQYINTPGSHTLTGEDGIVLVAAAGDVTLTGKTPADILVTPAAKGKTLAFDKAEVTGAVTIQADGMKVTKSDSKLPEIVTAGQNITVEDAKAETPAVSGGGGGGGGGGSKAPSVTLNVESAATNPAGTVSVGDKLKATTSNAGSSKLVWNVGGFDLEQETPSSEYTVTAADMGKEIFVKLVKEDGTVAAQSTKFTVAATAEVNVDDETSPVQIDLADENTKFYKEAEDEEGNVIKEVVTVSENDKLVLSIGEKTVTAEETATTKTAVKDNAEASVLAAAKEASGDDSLTLTEEQKADLAAATQVKAVDVDLTLVTTTTTDPGEGEEPVTTTTETPVHPVGETKVILSAAQLGLAGEDLNLYHFVASHTNVDNASQVVDGVVDEKGETVTFTTNGLSTIWIGNVPPRTVTFDTGAGGTKVDSQRVRFGGKVNTTKLPEKIERSGYLFCGWDYDLSKTPIISDLLVTAKWVVGTKVPVSRYTYKDSMGDQNFTFKEEDGRITITADPEVTYGAGISVTPTVTAYENAAKYYVSADAVTAAAMTDPAQFTAVSAGEITLSPAVTVTDGEAAVKGGKTSYFVKWLDESNAVLALEELTVVIDDGKGATDTKVVTRDMNRGVGTYEPYMTSSAKPDAPKWVGYINANPERDWENDERVYRLGTHFGFDQNFSWPENVTRNDYDVLHLDFTPFAGESYAGKSIIVEGEYDATDGYKPLTIQKEVTPEGKLALTISAGSFDTSSYSPYVNLYVTVGGVTQYIYGWIVNLNYVSPESTTANVDTMDELRAALAPAAGGAKRVYINYHGTEDVTLTDALTIPYTASVNFVDTCNFTVGSGGILTLEGGEGSSASFTLRENTFTVADGGKVVTVDKRPAQNYGSMHESSIAAGHVTLARGGRLEVQAGTSFTFRPYNSNGDNACVLETGSVVKVNGATNNYADFDVRNFSKATLAGQIDMVNHSQLYIYSDVNELSGTVALNGNDKWSYIEFYGDTTITGTGKLQLSGRRAHLELRGSLTNQGTIALSGNAYGIFTNTGYAQHNEGTITIASGSHIECEGTKLMNTGTISGAGELRMNLGDDTTDYGDNDTGVEYVSVDYNESSPSNYSRYKFTSDPAATVEVTLYKAELVNEQGGTCTAKTTTEDFPAN